MESHEIKIRHYIRKETLISVMISMLINVFFGFVALEGRAAMPVWDGFSGISFDLIPTGFLTTLPLVIAVTVLTRNRVRNGRIPNLDVRMAGPWIYLPYNVVLRGFVCAAIFSLLFVPVIITIFTVLQIDSLPAWEFIIFKICCGASIGFLVTPFIVRMALQCRALPLDNATYSQG